LVVALGAALHAIAARYHLRKMKSTHAPRTGRLIVAWPDTWPDGLRLCEHRYTTGQGEPFDLASRTKNDDLLRVTFEKSTNSATLARSQKMPHAPPLASSF